MLIAHLQGITCAGILKDCSKLISVVVKKKKKNTYYQLNLTRKESKSVRGLLTVPQNNVLKSIFVEVVTLSFP